MKEGRTSQIEGIPRIEVQQLHDQEPVPFIISHSHVLHSPSPFSRVPLSKKKNNA